jgi:hypothetical protein
MLSKAEVGILEKNLHWSSYTKLFPFRWSQGRFIVGGISKYQRWLNLILVVLHLVNFVFLLLALPITLPRRNFIIILIHLVLTIASFGGTVVKITLYSHAGEYLKLMEGILAYNFNAGNSI